LKEFYHYTIVGAGASGLWLAYYMLKNGLLENQTLCVVENDLDKKNDRTWCYWAEKPINPIEINSKSWNSIFNEFFPGKSEALSPFEYYHIRSQDFYSSIKNELSKCKNIHWKFEEITEFEEIENRIKINSISQLWYSDRIFSSCHFMKINNGSYKKNIISPIELEKNKSIFIWQSFYGWRIKTKQPAFNADSMSMMNFNIYQGEYTQFIYELPFSENEALIEMTRFGKEKITKNEAEIELKKWVGLKNVEFEISEIEIGAIPMTNAFENQPAKMKSNERIIFIGTPAGAIKPTTGYGFKKMQEYADELTLALAANDSLPSMLRKRRFKLYDILLLQILRHKPEKGKIIFESLFKNQPIKRILKFLDEKTNLIEEIQIFYRLPIKLFLHSLFNHILKR
jgi:lycopene beta-cyclase